MAALEWPLCTPPGYVRTIVPITTSSYQSAWSIAWNEAQKEAIRADGEFNHGWYTPVPSGQPRRGLGAARMVGMLTYRSYQSFEARFHRKPASSRYPAKPTPVESETGLPTPSPSDKGSVDGEAYSKIPTRTVPKYSAQSYMQYQAEKFLKRFDANCFISLLDKMDSHDVTRDRLSAETSRSEMGPSFEELKQVLSAIPPRALVISVETDVLFRNEHQIELAQCLPEARFINLDSDDGHDGFLLEFEALSMLIGQHLRQEVPWVYESNLETEQTLGPTEVIASVFGEAEPEF
jgi:homoserine O-acetyltransferase